MRLILFFGHDGSGISREIKENQQQTQATAPEH
jgi:hypothetical protein